MKFGLTATTDSYKNEVIETGPKCHLFPSFLPWVTIERTTWHNGFLVQMVFLLSSIFKPKCHTSCPLFFALGYN